MRFALIDDMRVEATTGSKGVCPGCSQLVIAKCGSQRVSHWAHKSAKTCDDWWEPETEWHRNWKNNYPHEWQEVFLTDEKTGEKHISDVRTDYNMTLEFQHSHLNPNERIAREQFYKNMIWIVDGTRLKRDFKRFSDGVSQFSLVRKGLYKIGFADEYFPEVWLGRPVPVIFDFQTRGSIADVKNTQRYIYCIFPVKIGGYTILAELPYKAFVEATNSGDWISRYSKIMEEMLDGKKQQEQLEDLEKQIRYANNRAIFNRKMNTRWQKRRRF